MAVANFTHTSKDQAEPISNHDGTNDNVALQELSAFLAGKITSNVGSFAQVTYSEIDRSTTLDGVDLRYAQPLKVGDTNMILGFDFNNNPTMQDPYNTLGAWSFPYTSSDLVPGRNASPFLLGGIEHQAAGLSSYVYLNNSLYLEVGGYTSLSHGLLDTLGVADEAGKLSAIAPYGRLAFNQSWGRSSGSIGLVAMQASLHPERETGPTNKYSD